MLLMKVVVEPHRESIFAIESFRDDPAQIVSVEKITRLLLLFSTCHPDVRSNDVFILLRLEVKAKSEWKNVPPLSSTNFSSIAIFRGGGGLCVCV